MLALWTSHDHHSLFFLISLLTFYTGIGVFWLYMFYSRVSWVVDLLAHLLHYFFLLSQHHTSLFISSVSSFIFFHHIFLCHGWWSFTFRCMKDGYILLHSYLMDVSSKILNLEGHLGRESSLTSLFESISISLCILKKVHLLIFRVCAGKRKKKEKKEKEKSNKHMYTMSSFIKCLYWSLRLLYRVSCLWKFVCEISRGSHLFVSISLCILCVTDKLHFPRDFESLSSPSLHTLVIWLFSMTSFEWISAHSFFFNLFVLLMISHSP